MAGEFHDVLPNLDIDLDSLDDFTHFDDSFVGYDRFTDIAVIEVPGGRLIPAMRAQPDEEGGPLVHQGDMVFAFGSPFDFRFSMSSGIVSGKGRSVGVIRNERGRPYGYENFIQVDAAINPGNSGGPLVNIRGQVVGINSAIASNTGFYQGYGFAIPMNLVRLVAGKVQKVQRLTLVK